VRTNGMKRLEPSEASRVANGQGGILQKGEARGKRLNTSGGTYVQSTEGSITGQKKRREGAAAPLFAFNQHRAR
jgi:hypothetical protein